MKKRWLLAILLCLVVVSLHSATRTNARDFVSADVQADLDPLILPERFLYNLALFDPVLGQAGFDTQSFVREHPWLLSESAASIPNREFGDVYAATGMNPQVVYTLISLYSSSTLFSIYDEATPLAERPTDSDALLAQVSWLSNELNRHYLDVLMNPSRAMLSFAESAADDAIYRTAERMGLDIDDPTVQAQFAHSFQMVFADLFTDPFAQIDAGLRAASPGPVITNDAGDLAPPFASPFGEDGDADELLAVFRDAETYPYTLTVRHQGVDLVNPALNPADAPTTTAYAAYDGQLIRTGSCAVIIEHELPEEYAPYLPVLTVRTYYTHLISDTRATNGAINRGEPIGQIDETGPCQENTPHIHVSISPQGMPETAAIDASIYFGANFNYDKGARGYEPGDSTQPFTYETIIGTDDSQFYTFESEREKQLWRTIFSGFASPPTGAIGAGGIDGYSGEVIGQAIFEKRDGLILDQDILSANQPVVITFDVQQVAPGVENTPPYMEIRSQSGACETVGMDPLDVGSGDVVNHQIEVNLGDCSDYFLAFGERSTGSFLVDNIGIYPAGGTFYSHTFSSPNISDWTVVDAPGALQGPSVWEVVAVKGKQVLRQNANIATTTPPLEGTHVFTGAEWWMNYHLGVDIDPDDDDGIYILFRYQDADNYYRFALDRQNNFMRLEKKVGGTFFTLVENLERSYGDGWHHIDVAVDGTDITVSLEHDVVFQVSDDTFTNGKIGLGTWASEAAHFDNVIVSRLPLDPYADEVVAASIGGILNTMVHPHEALGQPNAYLLTDYVSMGGPGYWLILDMGAGETISDQNGSLPDFRVYEAGGSLFGLDEPYDVFAGNSPAGPWEFVGSGWSTSEFDLSLSGLTEARYLRIEDTSALTNVSVTPGSDIDAVQAYTIGAEPVIVAPQNIEWVINGSDVVISWEAVPEAVGYHVYVSVLGRGVGFALLDMISAPAVPLEETSNHADMLADALSYTHLDSAAAGYYYVVTAVHPSGYESRFSREVSGESQVYLPMVIR